MLVEVKSLDKLERNLDRIIKNTDALWELAHIINATTAQKDRKRALLYCMQQIKGHQFELTMIKEAIEKLLQGDAYEAN